MTHTRTPSRPQRYSCYGQPHGQACLRGRACRCTCRAHCRCGQGAQHGKLFDCVIKYPYHYCHVTISMVQWILSHDNERELNDGRRTSRSPQRVWLESLQRKEASEDILLCSQVETGPSLPDLRNKVARADKRKSSGENRGCVRVANVFSVTAHSSPIDWTRFSDECGKLSPHAYYSRETVIWQHSGDNRATGRQGVAGGEYQ